MNKIFQLFSAIEASAYFNSLEVAKTKLESMKIVSEQKRRAVEQAELEALEAKNDVEVIELEIEVIKRKGFIEETFWRFPHIGEQIFGELDEISLSKCLEVNKWWQKFVTEGKILQINQIEKNTHIKASILKKALGNKDFETVQNLAKYSMKVYKKVISDGINDVSYLDLGYDCRKQQSEILHYLFEKKHRDKIQYLLTKLMLENTIKVKIGEIQSLVQNGDFELLHNFFEKVKIFKLNMEMSKKIHFRWKNGDYSEEDLSEAILALDPDLYDDIYKGTTTTTTIKDITTTITFTTTKHL